MPMFSGSLRLAADPESRVRAEIEVDDERLVVRAGGDELGNWDLGALSFQPAPGEGAPIEEEALPDEGEASADDFHAARRRVLLNLRYTQPPELVRTVIRQLASERGGSDPFVRLESEDDVPEVLLDRTQASEALRILLVASLEREGDPAKVRGRVSRTQAEGARRGRRVPAACIQISSDTPDDGDDGAPRRAFRRTDLAAAEKLIEANGGRLLRPRPDEEEQVLTVLLRGTS